MNCEGADGQVDRLSRVAEDLRMENGWGSSDWERIPIALSTVVLYHRSPFPVYLILKIGIRRRQAHKKAVAQRAAAFAWSYV